MIEVIAERTNVNVNTVAGDHVMNVYTGFVRSGLLFHYRSPKDVCVAFAFVCRQTRAVGTQFA